MTYEYYDNNKYTDKLQDSLLGTGAIDKDTIVEYNNESYDNTIIYSSIDLYSFIYIYVYYQ